MVETVCRYLEVCKLWFSKPWIRQPQYMAQVIFEGILTLCLPKLWSKMPQSGYHLFSAWNFFFPITLCLNLILPYYVSGRMCCIYCWITIISLYSLWLANHFFLTCRASHITWLGRNLGVFLCPWPGVSVIHCSTKYSSNTSDSLAKSNSETNGDFSYLCSYWIIFTYLSFSDSYSNCECGLAKYSKQFSMAESK